MVIKAPAAFHTISSIVHENRHWYNFTYYVKYWSPPTYYTNDPLQPNCPKQTRRTTDGSNKGTYKDWLFNKTVKVKLWNIFAQNPKFKLIEEKNSKSKQVLDVPKWFPKNASFVTKIHIQFLNTGTRKT